MSKTEIITTRIKKISPCNGFILLLKAINKKNYQTCKILLEYGINVNGIDCGCINAKLFYDNCLSEYFELYGCPLIYISNIWVNTNIFNLLLANNADVNFQNKFGNTSLMYVTKNTEITKILLDYGANQTIINNNHQTAFMISATKGHLETCKLLYQRYPLIINYKDIDGHTALYLACYHKQLHIVEFLSKII